MRFAWVLGACTWIGCGHVSTSDYGIAAGFAAAAGALQVAELAHKSQSANSCGPQSCSGCCGLANQCFGGTADDACGTGGSICRDCVVNGHQACGEGVCSPSATGSASQAASTSPFRSGAAPTAQAPSQPCGQFLVFCFAGTSSVCMTDASGCTVCSCTPDTRLNETTTGTITR